MSGPSLATTDLCDAHEARVRVLALPWLDCGGRTAFHGRVSTLKAYEDNSKVREAVAEPGHGRVLLVDGGGSMARAMLGVAVMQAVLGALTATAPVTASVADGVLKAVLFNGVFSALWLLSARCFQSAAKEPAA